MVAAQTAGEAAMWVLQATVKEPWGPSVGVDRAGMRTVEGVLGGSGECASGDEDEAIAIGLGVRALPGYTLLRGSACLVWDLVAAGDGGEIWSWAGWLGTC